MQPSASRFSIQRTELHHLPSATHFTQAVFRSYQLSQFPLAHMACGRYCCLTTTKCKVHRPPAGIRDIKFYYDGLSELWYDSLLPQFASPLQVYGVGSGESPSPSSLTGYSAVELLHIHTSRPAPITSLVIRISLPYVGSRNKLDTLPIQL